MSYPPPSGNPPPPGGYPPQDAPTQYGGQPYGQPQGQPQGGNPYAQPQGQPYGAPQGNPYGQPGQQPYGQPGQPPYGQPPYGQPGSNPYAQPGQPPYGQNAVPPYGVPQGTMPGAYDNYYGGYTAAQPRYATFWWRFLASLIDGIIVSIPVQIIANLLGLGATTAADGSVNTSLGSGGSLFNIIVSVLYGGLFIAYWNGQTPGKKICGLRVVMDGTSGPVAVGPSFVRALVAIASGAVLLLGYLWMLWDPKKQTWHDKAANTIVIKE